MSEAENELNVEVVARAPQESVVPELVAPEPVVAETPAPVASTNGFGLLSLDQRIVETLAALNYEQPTPIQAETIPLLLSGRDLLGQAQTGTGKTAAFALPMIQRIDAGLRKTQVLVLAPTRELAIQVGDAFERYAKAFPKIRTAVIYGGAGYDAQLRQLKAGAHVVVGTPGRVMDHMRRGSLLLDSLRGLVLDEADEMLQMGFAEDVEWILSQSPSDRQIALFSATMPPAIRKIAETHLKNPAQITIAQKAATADTIEQRYVVASTRNKEATLARILEAEPIDAAIVFVKTRSSTEPLAEYLSMQGHRAAALNGDVAQKQRERIIDELRSGKIDIVVATDVAARGLDVQRISHVFNYDLPTDSEAYVHRIGRTGRAGRSGQAILFVHPKDRRKLQNLERATRQRIDLMDMPSIEAVNARRVEKFHAKITAALTHRTTAEFAAIIEKYRADHNVSIESVAAALASLVNQSRPLLAKNDMSLSSMSLDGDNRAKRRAREAEVRGPRHEGAPSPAQHERRGGRNERFGFEGPLEGSMEETFGDDFAEASESDSDYFRSLSQGSNGEMETFRIEVGHAQQVRPGNIVGAIANESGLDSSAIGKIKIFDEFSTVDLPAGMPQELLAKLRRVWVAGRQLRISRMTGGSREGFGRSERRGRNEGPRSEERPSFGKPFKKRPSGEREFGGNHRKKRQFSR
jgi:ATP-dependent RNA helicase DeaD